MSLDILLTYMGMMVFNFGSPSNSHSMNPALALAKIKSASLHPVRPFSLSRSTLTVGSVSSSLEELLTQLVLGKKQKLIGEPFLNIFNAKHQDGHSYIVVMPTHMLVTVQPLRLARSTHHKRTKQASYFINGFYNMALMLLQHLQVRIEELNIPHTARLMAAIKHALIMSQSHLNYSINR